MFFLSWRQLMARKKQSILILLGISLGTLLYVSISGLQLGMRTFIIDSLMNNTAHVLISGAERSIDADEVTNAFYGTKSLVNWAAPPYGKREEVRLENYQGWYQRLSQDSDVIDFSPRLTTQAIISNGQFTSSVGLIGTVPDRHARITNIDKYFKEGSIKNLSSGISAIVIGSEVAKNLGVRLNQYVDITTGRGAPKPFKVVGIVHFGNVQVDGSIAFAELSHVQSLTKTPGRVSQIAVALYRIESATQKANEWKMLGTDKVQDWQEANKMFMEMINFQDYTRYFITIAILIVAAFGIYNVLTIMINQKKKEIAILRAIGYGPKRILELILYQGLLLGITGGLIGLFLGFLLCKAIGSIDMGFEIGGSKTLLVDYSLQIYVVAFLAANFASLLASFLPARAASLLTPMDIIRAE